MCLGEPCLFHMLRPRGRALGRSRRDVEERGPGSRAQVSPSHPSARAYCHQQILACSRLRSAESHVATQPPSLDSLLRLASYNR